MAVQRSERDLLDSFLLDEDGISMPLPNIELEPHLLISKVRKHYMEYLIKLLSSNYETHQKLVDKNIYLPSAIWRCAKSIEMSAAQACMVVELYRRNIISVVNALKSDTKKGRLNKKLFDCLNKPPVNTKKTQTPNTFKDLNNCQCALIKRKRHRMSVSPKKVETALLNDKLTNDPIPATADLSFDTQCLLNNYGNLPLMQMPSEIPTMSIRQLKNSSPMPVKRMSVESQDSDELMMQLEKLFQGQANDDDLFEGTLCDKVDVPDENTSKNNILDINRNNSKQDLVIENHAAQIKSLDERLANLAGLLVSNDNVSQKTEAPIKNKKNCSSKWLCEEYFLKQKLHELLDQIGDADRKELEKIKEKFTQLFGYDSEDDEILSPLDETPEFIISCKERIAPWVVKLLTPCYIKGHIRGKGIFKALAKHLIRLIYQCSRYPEEYEVTSFVSDFLKNHKTIRCEADFKEFRIENI